jgi:hypothetical protein
MADIIPFRERSVTNRLVRDDYPGQHKRRARAAEPAIHPALAEFDRVRRDLEDERRRLRELIDAAWIKLSGVSGQTDANIQA